ncbi:MAG: DUF1203 domain-containing protein [Pseudomonadota bacterium]
MVVFRGLETAAVEAVRAGGPDANGMVGERKISDGDGNPCRHCLRDIPAGEGMLVLAWRPFATVQAYAELGPIFLCEGACAAWEGDGVPPILTTSPGYLVRGYGHDERIRYGTGGFVAASEIAAAVAARLADRDTAFVHLRSASNNCFQCRAERS